MRVMKKSAIELVTSPDFLASSDKLSVSRVVVLKNDVFNNKNVMVLGEFTMMSQPIRLI